MGEIRQFNPTEASTFRMNHPVATLSENLPIHESMFATHSFYETPSLVSTFAGQIEKVKRQTRYQSNPFYLLPGVGFDVRAQTKLIIDEVQQATGAGKSVAEVMAIIRPKNEQDIQSFKTEYLTKKPLFPIVLEIGVANGEKRVLSPLYGNKIWVESVSSDERDGVVKELVASLEQRFLTAKPGTVFIDTSPAKWSGLYYTDKNGNSTEIVYPDTQTHAYLVQAKGKIRGFTIPNDMTLEQNERFLALLGKPLPPAINLSEKEHIKRITEQIVEIPAVQNWNLEHVVGVLEKVILSPYAWGKNTFADIYNLLQRSEDLWNLDEQTQALADRLHEYIELQLDTPDNKLMRKNIAIALGLTILDLTHMVKGKKNKRIRESHGLQDGGDLGRFQYLQTLQDLQKIGGCAGGDSVMVASITPRLGVVEDQYGSLEFICPNPKCLKRNRRSYGKLEPLCQACKVEIPVCAPGETQAEEEEKKAA